MKVYYPKPDVNNYDTILALNEEDEILLLHFLGDLHWYEVPEVWQPIPAEVYSKGKPGDFPAIVGFHLTLSERALRILQPIMGESVELLPVVCTTGEQYFAIRVLDVVDCLDYSRALVRRYPNSDRVMVIDSFAFKDGCISDRNIFRLPELNRALVSQAFKDCVENNGLEGLIFKQVT
ncbi:imm11 family protein [Tychonema sp. BBK16]|uniref:imm11 family protein n=1 Tax=Tychonema sp. BBK16 TaxID=2699888 RepID=UPI001F4774BB|nr:DUF1629 domain-containing protein [Tychonema sp. BBK16]MCF6373663.1 hypothetical protein [Tychonema sp. BBK16]